MINVILVPLTTVGIVEYINELSNSVKNILGNAGLSTDIIVWPNVIKPPTKCFDWERVQYHANCVAKYIREVFQLLGIIDKYLVVAIGYLDGYEYGLNFVFGEALPGQNVAVVFTKRLKPEFYGEPVNYNLYFERLTKEVIHELGHLLKLEHCTGRCVMRFSNNIYEVDEKEQFFCEDCKRKLIYISKTK